MTALRKTTSRIVPMGDEQREVPRSALIVSVLALAVAASGNLLWPDQLPQAFALLWLLALIPPFLLSYYRGWEGATLALALGMVLLIGVEVGGSYLSDRQIRWWVVGAVILLLIVVSLGVGAVSDQLHRKASSALDLAYSDHLTGLPNRRTLEWYLDKEFAAAQRGRPLAIAIFDIDNFKTHNDTEGHQAGDRILKQVARVLDTNTRASDLTGRLGGDEFLAILGGVGGDAAHAFADRVVQGVRQIAEAEGTRIGVSAGVAAFGGGVVTVEDLLEAADAALYRAKADGGGRVVGDPAPGSEACLTP